MRNLFVILALVAGFQLGAQESKLALQYFNEGEYEKAAILYKKLYEKQNYNDYYFRYYFNSLMNLGDYDSCEKALDEALKRTPNEVQLYVRQGALYEKQNQGNKAEKSYRKAIDKLGNDRNQIIRTASAFTELNKYDYALMVYEKGVELTGDEGLFAANLAQLYQLSGNLQKMVRYYLVYAKKNASSLKYVKQVFQRQYSDSLDFYLQQQLYTGVQNDPEEIMYIDLLAWVFIQKKDYDRALRQLISLDRRLNDEGGRVFELAVVAEKDDDYDTAIKGYNYLIESKSPNNPYFTEAKRRGLACMRFELDRLGNLPEKNLLEIRKGYNDALAELGKNNLTAEISLEYADFEAYYMNRLDLAIEILQELAGRAGTNENVQARAKLNLGDYYLMSGEIWEGSLLYSQVDKSFPEGYLGELARFKNARLSYFNGDFEWAKIQLDVLKASTSKLISNDAIDLSVFISENIGLDSTTVPLQMYANAELKALQHRFGDAFAALDSIAFLYPSHELEDDIWYLKANIYADQKNFERAEYFYNQVVEKHADDIRGDNAMFELAGLYENQLDQPEKATKLYEKIFIDHSNSTFAIEARKRYRALSKEEKFMRGIKD